jgi:hypothetical protein
LFNLIVINAHHKAARKVGNCLLLVWPFLLLFSCATHSGVYREIDRAVHRNEFLEGLEAIRRGQEGNNPVYPPRNAVLLFLDKGLLQHYAGRYHDSSISLLEAERLIGEAYTRSISENIASYILNDNTKEYPGEDYEDIYINVFNALNFYHKGNLEGAMVEIRKITMPNGKLDMLSRKHGDRAASVGNWTTEQLEELGLGVIPDLPQGRAVNFSNSALARYLSFLFYQGEGNMDSARIEFQQIYAAYAAHPNIYRNPVPRAVAEAWNVPSGKTRLNIVSFAGLSPVKEERRFVSFFPFFRNPILRWTSLKLPVLAQRPGSIDRIEVVIDNNRRFYLELLEDMGAVMKETFNARFSSIFFKTYTRVMLKYAAADIAATSAGRADSSGRGVNSSAAVMSAIAGKMAIYASENADIRMSRYLPGKAYIGGINLEPGFYTVRINYFSEGRIIARDERSNVHVRSGALNLIETICLR